LLDGRYDLSKKTVKKASERKEDMSIPPVFPAIFYKVLVEGAKLRGVSRAEFALEAAQEHLKTLKSKDKKDSALAQALGSEDLAKQFREANSKISKKWWSKLSEEEKTERARKAVEARWGKRTK
jgi:hypothetical protein